MKTSVFSDVYSKRFRDPQDPSQIQTVDNYVNTFMT